MQKYAMDDFVLNLSDVGRYVYIMWRAKLALISILLP